MKIKNENFWKDKEIDPISSAKARASSNYDAFKAAQEYAGEEWGNLSQIEKDEIVSDMQRGFDSSLSENKKIIKLTKSELQSLIKEGVEKLHKKNLIENRIAEINKELNSITNSENWNENLKNAQNQVRKNNIPFKSMIPKERLMNEGLTEKGRGKVKMWVQEFGNRETAKKIIDGMIQRMFGGLTSNDLPDSMTFADGLDTVEEFVASGDFDEAVKEAKFVAKQMIEEEGGMMFEKESKSEKRVSLKKLTDIAKNAGEIIPDAELELNSLGVAYGENIPKTKIIDILSKYDIEYKEVNFPRKKDKEPKTLSWEYLANKGLI